jgi:hypothetical protein
MLHVHRLIYAQWFRALVCLLVLNLAFEGLILSPSQALAHNGDVVGVPQVPTAPPFNAFCTNFPSDFGNAARVNMGAGVLVFMERTATDLYLCFVGIDRRDWFSGDQPQPNPNDAAYLYLDLPHSAPATPGVSQYQFYVSPTSATTINKQANSGDGSSYTGADPGGWDAIGSDCTNCAEFKVEWRTTLRISLATLGGSWDRTLGFMLVYRSGSTGVNTPWPSTANALIPSTWADLSLDGGTEPRPRIDGFEPISGDTPNVVAHFDGTLVHIHGYNLCANNPQVQFGTAPPVSPLSCSADGSELQARVQRLSVSGLITLTQTTGSHYTTVSSNSFTVRTFRNQHGFKFPNFAGPHEITLDDYVEIFGVDQFFVGVDPCIPFGGHCRIPTLAPDPIAYAFFGISRAILISRGVCFGFVLGSQRLMRGDVPFSRFGTTASTVWLMDTPSGPALPGLEHYLNIQHISQMSGEFLGHYLRQSVRNSLPNAFQFVKDDLVNALAQTPPNFRLISLRHDSSGHIVLAYDVEAGTPSNGGIGNGDYFIDVYDPNQPFLGSENSDPNQHRLHEIENGRIHVTIDNHWTFGGLSWSEGMDALVVAPYNLIPQSHPTMPSIADVLHTVILASGPVQTSQVRDAAGHTLLNADGSVNYIGQ